MSIYIEQSTQLWNWPAKFWDHFSIYMDMQIFSNKYIGLLLNLLPNRYIIEWLWDESSNKAICVFLGKLYPTSHSSWSIHPRLNGSSFQYGKLKCRFLGPSTSYKRKNSSSFKSVITFKSHCKVAILTVGTILKCGIHRWRILKVRDHNQRWNVKCYVPVARAPTQASRVQARRES